MTLIRELISIPDQVQDGDFVLKLTEGVEPDHAATTVQQYVVTPQLAEAFDEALGLIAASAQDGESRATYLHGSFGSGKSHFMAILHLLLQGNPDARGIPDLHEALSKWSPKMEGKNFLLVPLHFLTAKSMDATILGGYVQHVQELHPDAPLPAVFLGDEIIREELPHQRELLGDDKFLAELNRVSGSDDAWGEFSSSWTLDTLEEALAGTNLKLRQELTAAYISAFRAGTALEARTLGEGFVNLDDGLSAISVHAKSLDYDGIILFLDELILWLASHIGDLDFVQRESQKLTKLVEATNPDRPVPIISFVARQRDLRELVGDHIAGSELRSFADSLELQKGRFSTITLEDRNLPTIASKRLLRPIDDAAAAQLRSAVDDALEGREDIRQRLLTSDSDLELFRMVYPFSPAAVQTLVAVSEALQRERTALKVMLQLLVDHRDDLELGEIIPVGDLWDVVAERDEPFSAELKQAFNTAKTLYRTKFRPILLNDHGLTEDTDPDDPRWIAFENDDRIVKTILLAALVGGVEALRNLDAARLVALNWGSVTSPIPGRETTVLANKLRTWNALAGELKVGDDPANPSVSIALVNVDTDEIIARAIESFDTIGQRRQALRSLIDEGLHGRIGGELFSTIDLVWRGTDREIDVVFGNVRDTSELSDTQLRSSGDKPKVVVDFPFDEAGRGPEDDQERLDRFVEENDPTNTVCWVPSFFSTQGLAALRTYVAISELLKGDRYEQYTSHLSRTQRQEARPILKSRRDQLHDQLLHAIRNAYGVVGGTNPLIDPATSLSDHFRSLDPSVTIQPTTEPDMNGAFDQLADQLLAAQYPGHPQIEEKVTPNQRRVTWEEIQRALGDPDGRVTVAKNHRTALRNVANPLKLGTMHESHFILGTHWKNLLDRHLDQAKRADRPLTVADLRVLIDDPDNVRRGLPNELADLIILTVAAQTDHAIKHQGITQVSDGGRALPPDAMLVPQILPSEQNWERAVSLAGHVFGVSASPIVSAPEVARFADEVARHARPLSTHASDLVAHLGVGLSHAGLGSDGSRMRNAEAGRDLVSGILATRDSHAVVDVLAAAIVPTSEPALGRSLSTAQAVSSALADTNWKLLDTAGPDVMTPLRSVLEADEIAQAYDATRRRLEAEATRIVTKRPVPRPQSGAHTKTVTSDAELDVVAGEIRTELSNGPVEITWRRPPTA